MIKVVIAEDENIVRKALCQLVSTLGDMKVAGEASDGMEAVVIADRVHPDLILMDLAMPGMDGFTAAKIIKNQHPEIRIIALTSIHKNIQDVIKGLEAGLDGYLLKKMNTGELLDAVKTVVAGKKYINLAIKQCMDGEGNLVSGNHADQAGEINVSDRELQVLLMVCSGMSARKISDRLGISPRTVEKYRDSLRHKYGVSNLAELVFRHLHGSKEGESQG